MQLPTPKTPRYKDALTNRVPITPRHRISLQGRVSASGAPRTPTTPGNAPTVYHCARQLFTRSADPGPMVGREDERRALQTFIQQGIESKSGRCMYVSGPPGTGKSALVSEVCRNPSLGNVRTSHINCMSAKCSEDVYGKIAGDLGASDLHEKDAMSQLRSKLVPKKKSASPVFVVTLDEIDHLQTLNLEVLYTLFQWSLHRSSRLILIGIANALDLTDRLLPQLKARNIKPHLLPFLPYTAPQITSVIIAKLKSLLPVSHIPANSIPFVHPAAIQLCSKKVASQGGDLRKAFDITRRTIELIENETKRNCYSDHAHQFTPVSPSRLPLGENPNLRTPTRVSLTANYSLDNLTVSTAPRATLAHVSRVSAATLGNGTSQRLQTLNLQQKAALCALVSHQRSSRDSAASIFATPTKPRTAPSVRQIFETYCVLCKRENGPHPLTSTEFSDVISGLETLGLLGEDMQGRGFGTALGTPSKKRKGTGEEKRIVCFVDEEEVKDCLQGAGHEILIGLLGNNV